MLEVCVKLKVKGRVEHDLSMYMVGSCPQLGQWRAHHAVKLQMTGFSDAEEEADKTVWEGSVKLPKSTSISFRYFIGKMIYPDAGSDTDMSNGSDIEVILWETNIQPRQFTTPDDGDLELPLAEFGSYDGAHTISHGWLENHACVQVRFHDNPVFMWKPKHREQTYSIKCSPVDYEPGMEKVVRSNESLNLFSEDSSLEGPPPCNRTAMVYYNLNQGQLRSSVQPPTGCVYHKDDYLVFMARGFNQLHLGFQVDFYLHAERAEPQFVGSAHLLPPKMELSIYSKRVPIIGLNHRPIGEVQVEILRITPLANSNWTMDVSYQNHWKWRKTGATLNVGHRGMGSSYKRVTNVKENTIRSLYSAAKHGADMVELDVLLSKDKVPVIYHDFSVCLSTPLRDRASRRMVEVAIKDLTLEQLHSMKMFHSSSDHLTGCIEITDDTTEQDTDDQPFPTLQCCLERVDPQLGFNIEVKYPQLMETGENEQDNYFDMNPFIDRILDVALKYAGDRKIIFSTFHADSCIMLSMKQNKYPVLFLSNGPTQRYTPYKDWRCSNFQNGINFAKAEGLLGVNFQAEGLLQNLNLIPHIQSLGLVLFAWGEDLNEDHVKRTLRKLDVDAIIFDRIGQQHEQFLVSRTPSLDEVISRSSALQDSNAAGSSFDKAVPQDSGTPL